jgi:PAS domain S-box-containing protein
VLSDSDIIATVADDLPVGIWVARAPGGEFVYANHAFAEIMGMPARDDVAVGGYTQPYGIFDRRGRPYDEQELPFVRALRARAMVIVDDIVIHRPDGRQVNVRAHARPLFHSGELSHVAIAFFDITREVDAERGRDDFISAASHELKTPIGALQLRVQSILMRLRHDAAIGRGEIEEWAQSAQRQIRRLTRLSDSLLDVARIRAGRIELKREPLDLALLVREVVARVEDDLGGGRLLIRLQTPESLPGRGDPLRLDQVLTNLLSNAAKYGNGQPIEVTLAHADSTARLCVRDHGVGISAGDQERIFKPFERAVSPASYAGLGLGLWIVQEIVSRLDGRIALESLPGAGSTVMVELPWSAEA